MIKLSIERTWWFADQFYSGLFMQWNRISRIHSLLVACDVKIWRKYSLFTSVFDINGKEVETSNYRSNHPDVFCRKCVLKNYSKFSRNQLCQSFSFNKVADPRPFYRCFGRDVLSLFRIDVFIPSHGWGGHQWAVTKIFHTYFTMMSIGTVILYLKKIQKIYKSREAPRQFYWHQHFLP